MTHAFSDINWLAVVLAFIASAVLGGVYFGVLVSKAYLQVMGRTEAAPQRTVDMVGPPVCALVTILTSAVLVAALDLTTAADAIVFSLVVGVGYLCAMTFQIAINPNFPHPLRYGALNAPYFLVTSVITGLLLVLV